MATFLYFGGCYPLHHTTAVSRLAARVATPLTTVGEHDSTPFVPQGPVTFVTVNRVWWRGRGLNPQSLDSQSRILPLNYPPDLLARLSA